MSGLWQGASWTYALWSVMHGVAYTIEFLEKKYWKRLPHKLSVFLTFCFLDLSLVSFRPPDLGTMRDMYRQIFTGGIGPPMTEIAGFFHGNAWRYLLELLPARSSVLRDYLPFALYMGMSFYLIFAGKNEVERVSGSRFGTLGAVLTAILFLFCVISLAGVSSFLYFNF